jgi:N-acyl-L-homoserine lactone synthetase
MTPAVGILDGLVARVLATYPFRFTLATNDEDRLTAFRLRAAAVRQHGGGEEKITDDIERDEFDDAAVHVLGWDGDAAVCTGRIVMPPAALPTECACGIVVEPAGAVVDVGRMAVVPPRQDVEHAVFIALLCRLYLEMRNRGFEVACGMMSRRVRRLLQLLGLELEQLGPDREYWGEPRAPVRFELLANTAPISRRWG